MKCVKGNITDPISEFPTVATIGNFDGLHLGHQKLISVVNEEGIKNSLTRVLMSFTSHPAEILRKQKIAKITSEDSFRQLLTQKIDILVLQDFTKNFSDLTAEEFLENYLIKLLMIKTLVVGHDFAFGKSREGNLDKLTELCQKKGIKLLIQQPELMNNERISSRKIRELISDGKITEANELLGRNFQISGIVVHGDSRGRELGFPTANLSEINEILPADGVYEGKINIQNQFYQAMINIGMRPTFSETQRTVEVHIIDWMGDLYHQSVEVEIVRRLRDEMKFNSADALIRQLHEDKNRILGK